MAGDKIVLEAEVKSNIGAVAKDTENLAKATDKGSKGFGGLSTAIKGVGTALKAAGIGLVVALLAKLMEVFSKNQKVMDGFNVGMEALSIAFNDLFKVISSSIGPVVDYFKKLFEDPQKSLKNLGIAIKENLIERFESALDVLGHVGTAMSHLMKGEFSEAALSMKDAYVEMADVVTGVNNTVDKTIAIAKKAGTAIADYTTNVVSHAKAQVSANKAAEFAAVLNAKLNAEYLKEAESLRQIRDNVNLTFAERIKANDDLNLVLEKQQKLQKEALQTEMNALQMAYETNANDENKLALMQKEVEMLQLEEAINGQMSEQKTNAIGLENELRDAKQQTLLEGLEGMALEFEELEASYEAKIRLAEQAGMDTTAITEKYEKEQGAIKDKYQKKTATWAEMSSKQQLGVASATAGNMAKILGEETAAGQAFAITQATIDTFASAQGAYKAMAGIPVVGPALGAIAAAAAVAGGMANIAAIRGAGSGGGGGGGAGGGGAVAAVPPSPQMMSGEFDITGGVEDVDLQFNKSNKLT